MKGIFRSAVRFTHSIQAKLHDMCNDFTVSCICCHMLHSDVLYIVAVNSSLKGPDRVDTCFMTAWNVVLSNFTFILVKLHFHLPFVTLQFSISTSRSLSICAIEQKCNVCVLPKARHVRYNLEIIFLKQMKLRHLIGDESISHLERLLQSFQASQSPNIIATMWHSCKGMYVAMGSASKWVAVRNRVADFETYETLEFHSAVKLKVEPQTVQQPVGPFA